MGFFDLKFCVIILLSIIVYLMYREIINIKYKINFLFNKNKNIVHNDDLNKDLIQQLENEIISSEFNKNNNIYNKCVVKTIKIPLNLDSFLNSFERSYENEMNNPQIIELSSSNIEEVIISEKNDNITSPKNNSEIILLKQLETIHEETTDNNSETKSHIEIYSNNDSNIETSSLSIKENNISNELKIDYKKILKNLNKYKLPELQDIAIQFKLPKENNNKKKTRLELIEEIKNYISNKNI